MLISICFRQIFSNKLIHLLSTFVQIIVLFDESKSKYSMTRSIPLKFAVPYVIVSQTGLARILCSDTEITAYVLVVSCIVDTSFFTLRVLVGKNISEGQWISSSRGPKYW